MIKEIDAQELKQKLDKKEHIVLIDCREQNEWDAGHIQQAKLMPLSIFDQFVNQLDKNQEIIIQCRSGARSMRACHFLAEQGFNNLTNLAGGILGWAGSGFPIVEPNLEDDQN